MSRFADYLVDRDLVTREDIERATQHQVIYGARLGTNLVELKLIAVDQLAEALSDFHKTPLPPRKWLERPARTAVKRVSRPMVERIRFIPLRLDGNVMHAAVLDPTDPGALDNLRFATGCRVEPYVLPEIWMHDWLFTLFKIPRGIRHVETDSGPGQEDGGAVDRSSQSGPAPSLRAHDGPSRSGMPAERATGQVPRPSASVPRSHSGRVADPSPRATGGERDAGRHGRPSDRGPASGGIASGRAPAAAPRSLGLESSGIGAQKESPALGASGPTGTDEMVLSIDPAASPNRTMGASVRPPPVLIKALGELVGGHARQAGLPGPAQPSGAGAGQQVPAAAHSPAGGAAPVSSALQNPLSGIAPLHIPGPARLPALGGESEPETMWEREGVSDPWPSAEISALDPVGAGAFEPPKPSKAPSFGPNELAELEHAIAEADEREKLIEVSFSIATQFAQTIALFIVQKGTMQGVRYLQHGGTARPLDGLLISVELASMLTQAANATEPVRAVPGARALDARLLQMIGDVNASEVGLFPVCIRQRVVNLLYASNGSERLGRIAFAGLSALAQQMSAGYERLIMARKGATTNAPTG